MWPCLLYTSRRRRSRVAERAQEAPAVPPQPVDVYKRQQLMNEQAAKVPAGSYGMMCAFSDVMNYIAWRHAAPTFTNFDFDPETVSYTHLDVYKRQA